MKNLILLLVTFWAFNVNAQIEFQFYQYKWDSTKYSNLKWNGILKNGKRHGLWTAKCGNIDTVIVAKYENGKAHGKWKYYSIYRQLMQVETYSHDLLNGIWINYALGDTTIIANYISGKREGEYSEYYVKKILRVKGTYHNNLKEGLWTFTRSDAQHTGSKTIYTYLHDTLNGLYSEYWDNKLLRTYTFKDGVKNGACSEYFENGKYVQVGTYSNNLKVGDWIQTDTKDNRVITSEHYSGNNFPDSTVEFGFHHDTIRTYYNPKDGKVSSNIIFFHDGSIEQRAFNDTTINGIINRSAYVIIYNKRGQLNSRGREIYSDEGRREVGVWIYNFQDGELHAPASIKDKTYTCTWYRKDGSIWATANVLNGLIQGPLTIYNINGDPIPQNSTSYAEDQSKLIWVGCPIRLPK